MSDQPNKATSAFGIGAVLNETVSVLYKNAISFGMLALSLQVVEFGVNLLIGYWAVVGGFTAEAYPTDPFSNPVLWALLGSSMFLKCLLMAPITFGTYHHLQGKNVSIRECVLRGLAPIPRVFGVILIFWFFVIFWYCLLIMALTALAGSLIFGLLMLLIFLLLGLQVAVILWVMIPLAVVEGTGFGKGFRRSSEVTRNNVWRVAAVIVIITLSIFVILLLDRLLSAVGLPEMATGIMSNMIIALLLSVGAATTYFHLRRAEEGIEIEQIAAVFD